MKRLCKLPLSRVTRGSLAVMMGVDLLLMLLLPWLVRTFTDQQPGDKLYGDYLIILYISGIMAELAMWQCRGVLRNVLSGDPFGKDTARRLCIIGGECLTLAGLYLLFILVLRVFKFFMALLAVVFGFIGLMLFIFADLFRQAGRYKAENDRTI